MHVVLMIKKYLHRATLGNQVHMGILSDVSGHEEEPYNNRNNS